LNERDVSDRSRVAAAFAQHGTKNRFSPSFVITDGAPGQMLRVVYYSKEMRSYDRYGNA